jgi:Spy/CpxP family protein refolding chaperone
MAAKPHDIEINHPGVTDMLRPRKNITRTGIIAGGVIAAMLLTVGAIAWANPDMGAHYGMAAGTHCDGWKGDGHGERHMGPHNAANHFLKMGEMLDLTADQTKQLTKMRDAYIEKYATAEDQLRAAYDDLSGTLYGKEVDMTAANALLDKIGKLETQLWRAFAQQLHDIKAMLTPEQRDTLAAMWDDHPHGMGGPHGNMPMGHGDMPMRGDM